MEIWIKVAQLVLSLSILVILHELGHFVPARLFKTRVEKFYLFFNPWFSLVKFKKGETEYGIGWLPLGGYVKIAGMIDESMDKEQMKQEPKPDEFRSKKAWQRLIIMIGGVTVNIILAVVIYIFMLWTWGEKYLPNQNVKDGISVDVLGKELGLRNGDIVTKVDDDEVEDFFAISTSILLENAKTITVNRNDSEKVLNVPEDYVKKMIDSKRSGMILPRMPMIIDSIPVGSINQSSLMKKGDRIIGFNNSYFSFHDEFNTLSTDFVAQFNTLSFCQKFMNLNTEDKGHEVIVTAIRGNDVVKYPIIVNRRGKIEAMIVTDMDRFFGISTREYSFFEAIPAGVKKMVSTVKNYWKQLGLIFNKKVRGYENVGGFMSIGNLFPGVWDWQSFWSLTAFLSIMLAILNILPIPALDGGHVLFLLIEIVSGRKPSEKVMEIAQYIGFFLLLALILYANLNDVLKLF
ncbi:MAG: RIP metalloprotease RseP [Bacteroidetes bacterium HGW-Bacteroidetes-6]|jgi:regulator of sigma E protease|nr:MAG: RIP metalloprotease RseP [Bacteroidetes bacterium HGW-Bacteroidetes-6]